MPRSGGPGGGFARLQGLGGGLLRRGDALEEARLLRRSLLLRSAHCVSRGPLRGPCPLIQT